MLHRQKARGTCFAESHDKSSSSTIWRDDGAPCSLSQLGIQKYIRSCLESNSFRRKSALFPRCVAWRRSNGAGGGGNFTIDVIRLREDEWIHFRARFICQLARYRRDDLRRNCPLDIGADRLSGKIGAFGFMDLLISRTRTGRFDRERILSFFSLTCEDRGV